MKKNFIKATENYCDLDTHVAAPLLRRSFVLPAAVTEATVSICGLGFYRLFINGREITKGHIAPYVSNPDHICYYDTYNVTKELTVGENVIGVILGNGFQNCFGGIVWDFDKADFRGAPRLALEFHATDVNGEEIFFEADKQFKTAPSPILFDDIRLGEIYDAREEQADWCCVGFDDRAWKNALAAETPRGELRLCEAEPIAVLREISPVCVTKHGEAYLYDFGVNTAGICRLNVEAERGQTITLWHGEILKDGEFYNNTTCFNPKKFPFYEKYNQTVRYIASGKGRETYTPSFSYQGFRYVLVEGITEEQATTDLLTYLVMSSDIKTIGGFTCSDERVNTLCDMVINADRSNIFYFPTDCPHREKNGWTGDASLSADHMVLLYDLERSWRVWLDNIRKTQDEAGAIAEIVPTAGWGMGKNGPAWHSVLFNLPYMLYKFRDNTEVIRENAHAMLGYLSYVFSQRATDGTVAIGLGDWCPVGKSRPDAPRVLTDSVMVMDIAQKAAEMFHAIGYTHEAAYAEGIYREMRETVRRELIDFETMTVKGNCQTSQCFPLYYGVFEADEEQKAFDRLIELIEEKNNTFDCGFLGLHVLFHVLSRFGRADLAYKLIMNRDFPGYGYLIEVGETALIEHFMPDPSECGSHNHHFLGDIIRWFTFNIAGMEILDSKTVRVAPADIEGIDWAEAWYELPSGRVTVCWTKDEKGAKKIEVTAPEGVTVIK